MRANVLHDLALVKQAGQFAWLSIDIDQAANAAFNAKFPTEGVPSFLIIDPSNEKAALAWYGTATAPQLAKMMEDGIRAVNGGGTGADAALARADLANGHKEFAKAADQYREALQLGGPKWPNRSRTVESLVMALSFVPDRPGCFETAAREAPTMAKDRSLVNTLYFALDCSKTGAPELRAVEKLAEEAVKLPGILGDDISGLYMILAAIYRRDKNEAEGTRIANEWLKYLRTEIAAAKSPDVRMAFGFQLVSCANFLKKPELAIPAIERDEQDLPKDYNPPRLLASLYSSVGRNDDALAAENRAIERAYGLAKLRLYLSKGRILETKGDNDAARKAYEEGIAFGRTLPEQAAKGTITALGKALEARH